MLFYQKSRNEDIYEVNLDCGRCPSLETLIQNQRCK